MNEAARRSRRCAWALFKHPADGCSTVRVITRSDKTRDTRATSTSFPLPKLSEDHRDESAPPMEYAD